MPSPLNTNNAIKAINSRLAWACGDECSFETETHEPQCHEALEAFASLCFALGKDPEEVQMYKAIMTSKKRHGNEDIRPITEEGYKAIEKQIAYAVRLDYNKYNDHRDRIGQALRVLKENIDQAPSAPR